MFKSLRLTPCLRASVVAISFSLFRNLRGTFRLCAFAASLFFALKTNAQSQDTLFNYSRYPWLHPELNMIQFFDRDALQHFDSCWNNTQNHKLTLVHLGDSHLQPGVLPGVMRNELQQIHGDGGRGLVFPYSTANTYSNLDYKCTHTGNWTYSKSLILPPALPLGVIGMTSNTEDSTASFTLTFNAPIPSAYTKLKIFCSKEKSSYDFILSNDSMKIFVAVDSINPDSLPYYEVNLPPHGNSITLKVVKKNPYECDFEFYGMSLETSTDNGIILHNCGVGGAKYGSILYENLFMPQLHALKPDLVIVDFGTNDFLYDDSMKTNLVNQVIDVVSFIRSASPNTSIILTSTMDMYHKGHNVASSEIFSDSVRMIAKKFHCGFYDWYWISGGRMMMQKWNEAGLGRNDHIHLTKAGYTLKGHLFCEAMKNTLAAYDKSPEMDSLTFFMDSIRVQEHRLIADSVAASPDIYGSLIRHTVKHGESMSIIAKKYHVTITNLKSWNDLRTSHVRVGQQLVIYQKKKITPADSTKTNSPGTKPAGSKPSPKPAVHHTTGTVHHGTTNHPATKTSSSPKPHLAKKPH